MRVVEELRELIDDGGAVGSGQTDKPESSETRPEDDAQANRYEVARENCADAGLKEVARQFGTKEDEAAAAEAYGNAVSKPDFQASSSAGCLAGLLE